MMSCQTCCTNGEIQFDLGKQTRFVKQLYNEIDVAFSVISDAPVRCMKL
jgi:hypothetical protein